MKKITRKLTLDKRTVSVLNNQHIVANAQDPKLAQVKGGGPYISETRGTIYHCPSYPFYCPGEV